MKDSHVSGRTWVIADSQARLIEDIDTDQIFHNAFLHVTEISSMGQHALGNLAGWEDFPKKARSGDIIIAGRNFGAGSSRQQAVDCFVSLGIGMILAPSFGAIYFRNAVNSGFPLLKCLDLEELIRKELLKTGDSLDIDILTGNGRIARGNVSFRAEPMSGVQLDILKVGSLFRYGVMLNRSV
jgi:3-isopropylmalate/(R)-2-methylmalate dehydratase small subunit